MHAQESSRKSAIPRRPSRVSNSAASRPVPGNPDYFLDLQRTLGNRSVSNLIESDEHSNPVQRAEAAMRSTVVQRSGSMISLGDQDGFAWDNPDKTVRFEPFAGELQARLPRKEVRKKYSPISIVDRSGEALADASSMPGMVMEFDESPFSFAHRSYNGEKQAMKRESQPNDHLTIENSLPAMLAVARHDPAGMFPFLENRISGQKPSFNKLLGYHQYGEIDNLHFRPKGEVQEKANKGTNVVTSPVDGQVSLRQFLEFIDDVAERVQVSATIRKELRASVKAVQGKMGLSVGEMYFGTSGRKDLAKFVVMARNLTGEDVPDELQGLCKVKGELKYEGKTYVEGDEADKETALNFNQVVTKLIGNQDERGEYWSKIVGWLTNLQPTGAAGAGSAVHAMAG